MDSSTFWQMIDGVLDLRLDARAARLADLLAGHGEDDITDFADHVAEALHRLDTPAHSAAVGDTRGDAFLHIRCAAVLSGSRWYNRFATDPPMMYRVGGEEAEDLIFVAPNAYERATDRPWEHATPVSYETGSNPAWEHAVDDEPWWSWLIFSGGRGMHVQLSAEYELTSVHLLDALRTSEVWQHWWSAAPAPQAEIILHIDPADVDTVKVRKGRKVVRASVHRTRHGFDSAPDATEPEKARDDIRAVLAITAEHLDLPPMPDLPPLPALSEDELHLQRQTDAESAALQQFLDDMVRRLPGGGYPGNGG